MRIRNHPAAAISFFFFFFYICSCKCPVNSERIRVATLSGPSAMSMVYMLGNDSLVNEKLLLNTSIYKDPEQVKAFILNEQVEFAFLPLTTASLLYNRTGKYQLLGVPVWGTLYLCGIDSLIEDWNDLNRKEIYLMARGMTPDIMFRYLATGNGIDPDNDLVLNYAFNGHIELANALAAGVAERAVISEPYVSLVMAQNPSVRILMDFQSEWGKIHTEFKDYPQTALIVRKDFAREFPVITETVQRKIIQSIENLNDKPDEAAALIAKSGILPDSVTARMSIPLCNIRYKAASKMKREIDEYLKVFYTFNPHSIGGKIPDEGFIYKKEGL